MAVRRTDHRQVQCRGLAGVYVLDEHGVIRYKQVVEQNLDQAVDVLLKGMENLR